LRRPAIPPAAAGSFRPRLRPSGTADKLTGMAIAKGLSTAPTDVYIALQNKA